MGFPDGERSRIVAAEKIDNAETIIVIVMAYENDGYRSSRCIIENIIPVS